MHAISKYPQTDRLLTEIAIYQIGNKPTHVYFILSVSNEIDEIVSENGGEERYDVRIENLRRDKNYYALVFGNEILIEFLS